MLYAVKKQVAKLVGRCQEVVHTRQNVNALLLYIVEKVLDFYMVDVLVLEANFLHTGVVLLARTELDKLAIFVLHKWQRIIVDGEGGVAEFIGQQQHEPHIVDQKHRNGSLLLVYVDAVFVVAHHRRAPVREFMLL